MDFIIKFPINHVFNFTIFNLNKIYSVTSHIYTLSWDYKFFHVIQINSNDIWFIWVSSS
jgi:hypothetical protein